MRVLKWIIERVEGQAQGVENVFGISPKFSDLSWDGLNFSEQQFKQITSIDNAAWQDELGLHAELFDKLKHNLPAELIATKTALKKSLRA